MPTAPTDYCDTCAGSGSVCTLAPRPAFWCTSFAASLEYDRERAKPENRALCPDCQGRAAWWWGVPGKHEAHMAALALEAA